MRSGITGGAVSQRLKRNNTIQTGTQGRGGQEAQIDQRLRMQEAEPGIAHPQQQSLRQVHGIGAAPAPGQRPADSLRHGQRPQLGNRQRDRRHGQGVGPIEPGAVDPDQPEQAQPQHRRPEVHPQPLSGGDPAQKRQRRPQREEQQIIDRAGIDGPGTLIVSDLAGIGRRQQARQQHRRPGQPRQPLGQEGQHVKGQIPEQHEGDIPHGGVRVSGEIQPQQGAKEAQHRVRAENRAVKDAEEQIGQPDLPQPPAPEALQPPLQPGDAQTVAAEDQKQRHAPGAAPLDVAGMSQQHQQDRRASEPAALFPAQGKQRHVFFHSLPPFPFPGIL